VSVDFNIYIYIYTHIHKMDYGLKIKTIKFIKTVALYDGIYMCVCVYIYIYKLVIT